MSSPEAVDILAELDRTAENIARMDGSLDRLYAVRLVLMRQARAAGVSRDEVAVHARIAGPRVSQLLKGDG